MFVDVVRSRRTAPPEVYGRKAGIIQKICMFWLHRLWVQRSLASRSVMGSTDEDTGVLLTGGAVHARARIL